MAAYAALVSVSHIIETLQNHPRPPISLDKQQLQSLTQKITFLQEFLETHNGCEDTDELEGRIADAAYAAEDVIESHIVNQIEASSDNNAHFSTAAGLFDGLNEVIQDLDLIQRDTANFTKETRIKGYDDADELLHNKNPILPGGQDTSSVGLEDDLVKVMDKLTGGGHKSNRQIIPIVGMGGIGKTTLASNLYVNPVIVQHFDFRGWATISQEYNSKEILLEVLLCVKTMGGREGLSQKTEHELGDALYKSLFGRRYLIVLDDIWSIEAWDNVKAFFPDTNDGSAIVLTTRLSNLALHLSGSYDDTFEMSFLDEGKSWNLFCKHTFGEESCPRELEGVGKKILKSCKGLPLSIVVVGGLLAKTNRTSEYWLYIAGSFNSIVNLEDNERCLKILHLSYKELPVHLKPCFLYMGVFPEDFVIRVPKLMKLWVVEGFLKPISGKCLEDVAKEYFDDLVCRNLVLVVEKGCSGQPKSCKVHDLLVDLCVRESRKHKFLCVTRHHVFNNPGNLNTHRRIVVHRSTKRDFIVPAFPFHGTLVRSFTCTYPDEVLVDLCNSRLLRVCNGFDMNPILKELSGLVNCRYLDRLPIFKPNSSLLSSMYSLWNLQRLHVWNTMAEVATSEIWKMSQLRDVSFARLNLLDPPSSGHSNEYVLGTFGSSPQNRISLLRISFSNRAILSELQENLNFPRSLKKLTLEGTNLDFGDLGPKIGSLPHLQVLKLQQGSFVGPEWETVEGQFRNLKHLEIYGHGLINWRTESCTHFPCLERLVLCYFDKLEEIPPEIGETLKSIEITCCSYSVIDSANEILKEQKDLGNEGLRVEITD